jgi:hypothetical protein
MYTKSNVVSSITRQQQNRQHDYHGYHSTERQRLSVEIIDYHTVPVDTTDAALTSLDSKWTPRRHFPRAVGPTNSPQVYETGKVKCGGQGRNRTADASLFRAALYQLSYLAVIPLNYT